MNHCPKCRSWQGCPGFTYYSPVDIQLHYCRRQVLWLVDTFIVCQTGVIQIAQHTWPTVEETSGYTEAPHTQHSIKAHANYELVCQIVGELSARLQACGKDGQLLVLEAQHPFLSENANNALSFVSGKRRRLMRYSDYLRKRRYRGRRGTES